MLPIDGDILALLKTQGGCAVQQVNCQQAAGAGFALKIRERYPAWYKSFRGTRGKLGDATLVQVQVAPLAYIGSLYAQDKYGTQVKQTDSGAFTLALRRLVQMVPDEVRLWVPYGIGCKLGGGDWGEISAILERYAPHAVIVKYGR